MVFKSAYLEVTSKSKIILTGNPLAMKTLYQRLLPFLSPEMRMPTGYFPQAQPVYQPPPPAYAPPMGQSVSNASRFCPECGIELSPNMRFCHNCGKPAN